MDGSSGPRRALSGAILGLLVFAVLVGTAPVSEVTADVTDGTLSYECFPTCSGTDGRFASLAGDDYTTLAGDFVIFHIVLPEGTGSFWAGVFDGESGDTWDVGTNQAIVFDLFEGDAELDETSVPVYSWPVASLVDNGWADHETDTSQDAWVEGVGFVYQLRATLPNPTLPTWSSFKVRTEGELYVRSQEFGFSAPLFGENDFFTIYPDTGYVNGQGHYDIDRTTYDGEWLFRMSVPEGAEEVTIWDGDFDRGSKTDDPNEPTLDTDDPDTPGEPYVPDWALGTLVRSEGVAVVVPGTVAQGGDGCGTERSSTACPADDRSIDEYRRSPSIEYTVIDPEAEGFYNSNPSGNLEWEQFRLDTDPLCDSSVADYCVESLLGGEYQVVASGVDIANLNAWHFSHDLHGTPSGSIGDSVWHDADGDGVKDASETGINGITVRLYADDGRLNGSPVDYTLCTTAGGCDTDGDGIIDAGQDTLIYEQVTTDNPVTGEPGWYDFRGIGAGSYWIDVDDASLATAGFSTTATTGNEPYDLNGASGGPYVLAESEHHGGADFGYHDGTIGDFVWYDANGNHLQDEGETGIGGVTVKLYLDDGDGIFEPGADDGSPVATAETSADGQYLFTGQPAGSYFVVIDDTELGTTLANFDYVNANEGSDDSIDSDGVFDTSTGALVALVAFGEIEFATTTDFGFYGIGGSSGAIGDQVWIDETPDGVFTPNTETPIAGVLLNLWAEWDGVDGLTAGDLYLGSDLSGSDGTYGFVGEVGDGTYYVVVDDANFDSGGALELLQHSPRVSGYGENLDNDVDYNRPPVYELDIPLSDTPPIVENLTADFGFIGEVICVEDEDESNDDVGASIHYYEWSDSSGSYVTIRGNLWQTFADTAYGTNAPLTGWTQRRFAHIYGSDNLAMTITNGDGDLVYDFAIDLLAEQKIPGEPNGYITGGVGEDWISGLKQNDGYINEAPELEGQGPLDNGMMSIMTSPHLNYNEIAYNGGYGWKDQTTSPHPDPSHEDYVDTWIWDAWYEITLSLDGFGSSGLGDITVSTLHSSPAKTLDPEPPVDICD